MQIAMISYHTCPRASAEGKETGGMNIYVLELSRALAKLGHRVDIFTRSHEANDPEVITESANLRVMHIRAGPQSLIPKKQLPAYIPEFIQNAREFVRKDHGSYDLMHAHYYQSGLVAKKVLELAHIPFVMSFHTLALMKNLVARDTLERESQFRIRAEFTLMRLADRIVASSENDKEYMQYLYDGDAAKIHVVYPGINAGLFHPLDKKEARTRIGADGEHKIVLFVGRIEPLKGIDTLLYAMKVLKKKHPAETVCLWIVGGDTSEPEAHWSKTLKELSALRRTLGIPEESIHFVGRKPQTDLPYYYNAADVVVMPSHYESFGMSALEAMGCAVPVITTNVAGISTHVAHVISVNNPLLLAQQISHILMNPTQNTKPFNTFTWDLAAKKMLTVYSSRI
jgi:D-inositol-3-phosphate glycosyltransferase